MIEMFRLLIALLTFAVVLTTLVPLHSSPHWAVRMWDFPRLQILCVAALVAVFAVFLGQYLGAAALVVCIAYQWWWIHPYTPFGRPEIEIADVDPNQDITLLSVNIEMTNDNRQAISQVITDTKPDVLFLMETDQSWIDALQPILAGYGTVVSEPKDNYYGMVFATDLNVRSAEIVYLTSDNTPTLLAELETKSGDVFRFLGLHPRPPVPGEDTIARDEQLSYAARFGKVEDMDLVVMGDFNDVVWSRKSHDFKRVGGYLDPRFGRGFISSFHAKYPFMRFPIDHFFVTEGVVVSEFRRGPKVGSDHFPMIARVRFDDALAKRLNAAPEKIAEDEDQRINEMVARHRKRLDANADQ